MYDPFADDDELLATAIQEDRILLTRDGPLVERTPKRISVKIEHNLLDDQLVQLVSELGLDLDQETFTRCLLCNEPIAVVSQDAVRSRVPPYVLKTQERFLECPICQIVYWRGTHLDRMSERLENVRNRTAQSEAAK